LPYSAVFSHVSDNSFTTTIVLLKDKDNHKNNDSAHQNHNRCAKKNHKKEMIQILLIPQTSATGHSSFIILGLSHIPTKKIKRETQICPNDANAYSDVTTLSTSGPKMIHARTYQTMTGCFTILTSHTITIIIKTTTLISAK